MDKKKFYITSPIYYASGDLHLGHIYTAFACDVLTRWKKDTGFKTYFVTGSDEHGQKVERKAKQQNLESKQYTDKIVKNFKSDLKKAKINYDYFIRTTNSEHEKFVQKMLQISYDKGDIYLSDYSGLYCVECEQYYKKEELIDNEICKIHKKKVDKIKEKNYFFKLSKYKDKLLNFYCENPNFLSPSSKSQETINRVEAGLEDISISRNKNKLSWGIELPFDSNHVTYVWFDALFSYISALQINNKNNFWPASVHIIGKDIMWFHKVYWPAFLMSVGYELPKKIFAHGWWTRDGIKMGKSLNNILKPNELIEEYGLDELKYFLLTLGTFGDDLDFNYKKITEIINNDLNNDFGNLISRVHTMTTKYFQGIIPITSSFNEEDLNFIESLDFFEQFDKNMQELKFSIAYGIVWKKIRNINAYINKCKPWDIKDNNRLKTIINILISSCYLIAKYTNSIMQEKSNLVFKQFNLKNDHKFKFESIKNQNKINLKQNLFQKIKVQENIQNLNLNNHIEFKDLNLKVGKIIEIKNHPKAEKLFIEKIDIGKKELIQVISGLRDFYNLDELIEKKVIVVTNLKSSKLRGEISDGMILAVEDNSKVAIITTDAKIGETLIYKNQRANNENIIKIEDFYKIELFTKKNFIYLNDIKITIKDGELFPDKKIDGKIR